MTTPNNGGAACGKCQRATERLMQASSPFFTCPDLACCFHVPVATSVSAAAGGGVLDTMRRDAEMAHECRVILNGTKESTAAARKAESDAAIAAVAELIAAADCFSAAMAEDSDYLGDILDGIRPLERDPFVERLNRLRAALSNIEGGQA